MRRLPPHVAAKLAKRRGTATQRSLAMAAQRPLDPEWEAKLEKARDMIRERQPQFDFSTRATAKPGGK
jgi:hypothetical protein